MADSSFASFEEIRKQVRRLTGKISTSQRTDAQINSDINRAILYEFPSELKLFSLRTTLSFFTEPYIDTYSTDTVAAHPLYNFKNKYMNVYEPVFINGQRATLYQDRGLFYGNASAEQRTEEIGVGDSIETEFDGTLTFYPVLRNKVLFSAIDDNNEGLSIYDDGDGNLIGDIDALGTNTIDYVTGAYDFKFSAAPQALGNIYCDAFPYTPSVPDSILYFKDEFVLSPVPKRPYRVEIEADIRPTELEADADLPELAFWAPYIALLATRSIYLEANDFDSIAAIEPELTRWETLVNRRSSAAKLNKKTYTIFSAQAGEIKGSF